MDRQVQDGAVSIFAVIFAALLLTILTVGFIKVMVDDQRQTTDNDLSQSAYDASLAGVEDAKRVLQMCYRDNNPTACLALSGVDDCNVVSRARGLAPQEEVIVRSSTAPGSGEQFNQAYTCVNISMLTDDYLFELAENKSELIPLKSNNNFNKIVIDWYTQDDAGTGVSPTAPGGATEDLPTRAGWSTTAPAMLRTQLIRPKSGIDLGTIDSSEASQTNFLRPYDVLNVAGEVNNNISVTPGRARPGTPPLNNQVDGVNCSKGFHNDGYSCRVTLDLSPDTVSQADSVNTFLRVNAIYKGTSVRVRMFQDASLVQFDGVQPSVDSTGRASNLYRRVEVRLRLGDNFPYPNYAADVANSLCKDYVVTIDSASGGTCSPV